MKKIFTMLLVLVIAFSIIGCSPRSSSSSNPQSASETQSTSSDSSKETASSETSSDSSTDESEYLILKGKILPNDIPMGVGILLNQPMTIDGREVAEVYFDKDVITDLVPRKYFTYYFEGGASIDADKYSVQIPIEVEVNSDSFDFVEDLGRTSAVIDKVVSIDGEQNPSDKTSDEYPLEYYKQVFNVHVESNGGEVIPTDIKDHYLYKNTSDPVVGEKFKSAVDKLIENGYVFRQVEGEFSMELLSEADIEEIDLSLSAEEFLKKYPTDYVLTRENGGYHNFDTIYEYPYTGLTVTYYHDDKNDLGNAYLGSVELTSYKYNIKGLGFSVESNLNDAYEHCSANFEKLYNRHEDIYMDEIFVFNNMSLVLNDRSFGEYESVKPEDRVEKISIYLTED